MTRKKLDTDWKKFWGDCNFVFLSHLTQGYFFWYLSAVSVGRTAPIRQVRIRCRIIRRRVVTGTSLRAGHRMRKMRLSDKVVVPEKTVLKSLMTVLIEKTSNKIHAGWFCRFSVSTCNIVNLDHLVNRKLN